RCGRWLWRRGAIVRSRPWAARHSLCRDQGEPGRSVLGRIHPDAAARRDRWRFSRQADRKGRTGAEPATGLFGARRRNHYLDPGHSPAPRGPPGFANGGRVTGRSSQTVRLGIGTLLLAIAAPAIGGPPYQTDDPEPTDFGHWEI